MTFLFILKWKLITIHGNSLSWADSPPRIRSVGRFWYCWHAWLKTKIKIKFFTFQVWLKKSSKSSYLELNVFSFYTFNLRFTLKIWRVIKLPFTAGLTLAKWMKKNKRKRLNVSLMEFTMLYLLFSIGVGLNTWK